MLKRLRRHLAARRAGVGLRSSVQTRARANGVDVDALLNVARQSFVRVQAAWDAADLRALACCTTAPLLADLRCQLDARGPGPNCTEVLSLHAELLALEEICEAYVASVEFSGFIRERVDCSAAPFRELWLLAHPKSAERGQPDRGWQLAGVQSLI